MINKIRAKKDNKIGDNKAFRVGAALGEIMSVKHLQAMTGLVIIANTNYSRS